MATKTKVQNRQSIGSRKSQSLKKSSQPITALQSQNKRNLTPDKLLPLFVIVLIAAISYFFWSARALTTSTSTKVAGQDEQVHKVSASDDEPTPAPTPKPVAPPLTNADLIGDYKTSIYQPTLSQMANVTLKFINNGNVNLVSDETTNNKHGTWTLNQQEQTVIISLTSDDFGKLKEVEVIKLQAQEGHLTVTQQENSTIPNGTIFSK